MSNTVRFGRGNGTEILTGLPKLPEEATFLV
jgi:hypothetical protein